MQTRHKRARGRAPRATHVIPTAEAEDRVMDGWRLYGYDAGWNDPRVILEIGKTPAEQLVVLDKYYERESHVEDALAWLTDNEKPSGTIYCDHEPEHVAKFRRADFQARNATKDLDAGIAKVRKRLEADGNRPVTDATPHVGAWGWEYARGPPVEHDLEHRVGLVIAQRCEHVVREFLSYKTEHVGTAAAEDHRLDALRYACMGVASDGNVTQLTW